MKTRGQGFTLKLALALCLGSGMAGGLAVKYADSIVGPSYALELRDAQAARESLGRDAAHARGLSEAFTSVATAMRPSVVHINATTRVEPAKNSQRGQRARPQIPDELRKRFGDDMFERFFDFEEMTPQQHGYTQRGQGTGVIISEDGYIATNNHVVRGATELLVRLADGHEYTGKVIGQDEKTDVAVIKIDAKNLMAAPLGNSDKMQVGEWVLAIGSPFGLDQTVTAGIISAKGRANVGISDYEDFLQTDAAVNPGNSGGPLVNMHGEVIGINTAIASRNGGSAGVGFAIPSNMVKLVTDSLIKEGKVTRGWLGAAIQDLNEDLAQSFGYKSTDGVLVGDVVNGSPAEKAGLKSGDIVIKFKDQAVRNAQQLRNAVAATKPNTRTEIMLQRDGKPITLSVTIGELTAKVAKGGDLSGADTDTGSSDEEQSADALGLSVQTIDDALAEKLGVKESSGVAIVSVEEGSAAENAGLQAGDVVASVSGKKVHTAGEYRDAMKEESLAKGVRMQVSRDGVSRFVFLRAGR
jgi:serine protease Do